MATDDTFNYVKSRGFAGSSRFLVQTPFLPLTAAELRQLASNPALMALTDEQLDRLWIRPISIFLQNTFRIDASWYSASTVPKLAELTEDFKVATALCVDKFSRNVEDLTGQEAIEGAGSATWNHQIPTRARALLERYITAGGRVSRV